MPGAEPAGAKAGSDLLFPCSLVLLCLNLPKHLRRTQEVSVPVQAPFRQIRTETCGALPDRTDSKQVVDICRATSHNTHAHASKPDAYAHMASHMQLQSYPYTASARDVAKRKERLAPMHARSGTALSGVRVRTAPQHVLRDGTTHLGAEHLADLGRQDIRLVKALQRLCASSTPEHGAQSRVHARKHGACAGQTCAQVRTSNNRDCLEAQATRGARTRPRALRSLGMSAGSGYTVSRYCDPRAQTPVTCSQYRQH